MTNPYQSPLQDSPPEPISWQRLLRALLWGMRDGMILGGLAGGVSAGLLGEVHDQLYPDPASLRPPSLGVSGFLIGGLLGGVAGTFIGPVIALLGLLRFSEQSAALSFAAAVVCGLVGAALGVVAGGILVSFTQYPTSPPRAPGLLAGGACGAVFGLLGGAILGFRRSAPPGR